MNGLEQFGGFEAKGVLEHWVSRRPGDQCLQVSQKATVIFIGEADPTTLVLHPPAQGIKISFQTIW